jgi:glycine cleavage system H protein
VELGDVAYVDLPAVGVELAAGEPFGVVESAKAVSELYAPVTGRVTAVNETLATAPRTLNEDPYGAGWLLEVTPTDEYPADLLDAATYRAHVDG